jgi:tRNA threonylcarbamoyladenosine biosynthesis protein TsaB
LGAFACGAGPGSFSGVRVGIAAAKGLAMPADLPLVLVSSLHVLADDLVRGAAGFENDVLLAPCIDAGKDQVYGQLFLCRQGQVEAVAALGAHDPGEFCEYIAVQANSAGGMRLVAGGTGVERYADIFARRLGEAALVRRPAGPSAESLGRRALARLASGQTDDLATAVPTYGRAPDITRPRAVRGQPGS